MNKRHRRRRWATESKKNLSNTSIVVAAISGAALIYLIVCLVVTINTGGEIPNFMGALGMVFFLATIPCIVIGRNKYKMTNYNFMSRLVGIAIPIVAAVSWGILYILGLVFA